MATSREVPGASNLEAAVRQMGQEFVRHFMAKDLDKLVQSYYTEDACVLPPNQPMVRGRAEIRQLFQNFVPVVRRFGLETEEVQSSGDLVYEIGRFTMMVEPPGAAPAEDNGKYLVVMRRQPDGSLRVVADMFSSDRPPR